MGEGRRFKETRKHVKVADHAFVYDFLLKVEVEVRPEHVLRFLGDGIAHKREHPKLKGILKIEVIPHLRSEERMAQAFYGTPAKEIDPLRTFEFPCAGTREDETLVTVLFDEIMDGVKQTGDTLDFIDDNGALVGIRLHHVDQGFWPRQQGTAHIGLKEVYGECTRKLMAKPHRFPRATRAEKEETTAWETYHSLFHGVYDTKFLTRTQPKSSIAVGKKAPNVPLASE